MKVEDIINAVVVRAVVDTKYKEKLVADPVATINEAGVKLKEDVSVKFYYSQDQLPKEANESELALLFPLEEDQKKIKDEFNKRMAEQSDENLSNDDLEKVTGGTIDSVADGVGVVCSAIALGGLIGGVAVVSAPVLAGATIIAVAACVLGGLQEEFEEQAKQSEEEAISIGKEPSDVTTQENQEKNKQMALESDNFTYKERNDGTFGLVENDYGDQTDPQDHPDRKDTSASD